MSRLTKFIESLQRNVVVIQSKTTNSQYFELGSTKIRVSDHFSERENAGHIQIVIPFNSKTIYLCKIKEGAPILSYTLKELKQFISNYVLINNIKQHTKDFESNKDKVAKEQSEKDKLEYQKEQEVIAKVVAKVNDSAALSKLLGFDIDNPTKRLVPNNYIKCTQDIKRQCKFKLGDLGDKKRKVIREQLIGSNLTWIEIIKALKEAKETKILKKDAITITKWVLTKIK